jgi:hypothetical protein
LIFDLKTIVFRRLVNCFLRFWWIAVCIRQNDVSISIRQKKFFFFLFFSFLFLKETLFSINAHFLRFNFSFLNLFFFAVWFS